MPPPKNAALSSLNHKLSINDFQKQILQLPRHGQNVTKSPNKKPGHKTPEEKRRKKTSSSEKNKLATNQAKTTSDENAPPGFKKRPESNKFHPAIVPPKTEYNEFEPFGYEDDLLPAIQTKDDSLNKDVIIPPECESEYDESEPYGYEDGMETLSDFETPSPLNNPLTPAENAMVKRMMEIQKHSFTAPRLPIPPTPPTAPRLPIPPTPPTAPPFSPIQSFSAPRPRKHINLNQLDKLMYKNAPPKPGYINPANQGAPNNTQLPNIQRTPPAPVQQYSALPGMSNYSQRYMYPEDGKFKMTSDSLPPPPPPPPPSQYPNQNEVKFITNILLDKNIEEPQPPIGPQLPHNFIKPQPSPGYKQRSPHQQPVRLSPGSQLQSNYQPASPQHPYNYQKQQASPQHYPQQASPAKSPYYPPRSSEAPSSFQPFSRQLHSNKYQPPTDPGSSFQPISPKNPKPSLASFKLPSDKLYDFSAMSDYSESDNSLDESNDSFTVPTFSQLNSPNWRRQLGSRVQDGRWAGADRTSGGSGQGSSSNVNRKPRSSCSSPVTRDVRVSKMLGSVCRHNAAKFNLAIVDGGYLFVEEILNTEPFKKLSVTQDEVFELVKSNDKQRFSIRQDPDGHWQICANQGHSMAVPAALIPGREVTPHAPKEPPLLAPITDASTVPTVVHGTYKDVLPTIQQQGLSRMNRTHIHFAPGMPQEEQVISGMRGDCEVYIYIDLAKALHDGYKFFKSVNNVILCSGNEDGYLPPSYFSKVVTNNRAASNNRKKRGAPRGR